MASILSRDMNVLLLAKVFKNSPTKFLQYALVNENIKKNSNYKISIPKQVTRGSRRKDEVSARKEIAKKDVRPKGGRERQSKEGKRQ